MTRDTGDDSLLAVAAVLGLRPVVRHGRSSVQGSARVPTKKRPFPRDGTRVASDECSERESGTHRTPQHFGRYVSCLGFESTRITPQLLVIMADLPPRSLGRLVLKKKLD